jgi:hypothetical protein
VFVVVVRVVSVRPVVRMMPIMIVVADFDRLADSFGHKSLVEKTSAGTAERAHGPEQNKKHLRPQHFECVERRKERDSHVAATPITALFRQPAAPSGPTWAPLVALGALVWSQPLSGSVCCVLQNRLPPRAPHSGILHHALCAHI